MKENNIVATGFLQNLVYYSKLQMSGLVMFFLAAAISTVLLLFFYNQLTSGLFNSADEYYLWIIIMTSAYLFHVTIRKFHRRLSIFQSLKTSITSLVLMVLGTYAVIWLERFTTSFSSGLIINYCTQIIFLLVLILLVIIKALDKKTASLFTRTNLWPVFQLVIYLALIYASMFFLVYLVTTSNSGFLVDLMWKISRLGLEYPLYVVTIGLVYSIPFSKIAIHVARKIDK